MLPSRQQYGEEEVGKVGEREEEEERRRRRRRRRRRPRILAEEEAEEEEEEEEEEEKPGNAPESLKATDGCSIAVPPW
jgi:hypothetical protein